MAILLSIRTSKDKSDACSGNILRNQFLTCSYFILLLDATTATTTLLLLQSAKQKKQSNESANVAKSPLTPS